MANDSIVGLTFQALNRINWSSTVLGAYEEGVKRNEDNKASEYFVVESIDKN